MLLLFKSQKRKYSSTDFKPKNVFNFHLSLARSCARAGVRVRPPFHPRLHSFILLLTLLFTLSLSHSLTHSCTHPLGLTRVVVSSCHHVRILNHNIMKSSWHSPRAVASPEFSTTARFKIMVGQRKKVTAVTFFPARPRLDQTAQIRAE